MLSKLGKYISTAFFLTKPETLKALVLSHESNLNLESYQIQFMIKHFYRTLPRRLRFFFPIIHSARRMLSMRCMQTVSCTLYS